MVAARDSFKCTKLELNEKPTTNPHTRQTISIEVKYNSEADGSSSVKTWSRAFSKIEGGEISELVMCEHVGHNQAGVSDTPEIKQYS